MMESVKPDVETTGIELPTGEQLEQIRRRAYELYESRGQENGRDVEDWLQAEAEITAADPAAKDL